MRRICWATGYRTVVLSLLATLGTGAVEAATCRASPDYEKFDLPATQGADTIDGPDQSTIPEVECRAGSYQHEHRVAKGSNGRFARYNLEGSHRFDAGNVVLDGKNPNGDFVPWPVKINALATGSRSETSSTYGKSASGCWYGGFIDGAWDEHGEGVKNVNDRQPVTWEYPFHHAGAMTIEMDNFLIEDVSVYNHGDGLRPRGDNTRIDGAYLKDIHDDCVENDNLQNLRVTDSLLDGCYVGFSARSIKGSDVNGSGKLVEIRDSLVRLEAQPTVYKPLKYGAGPGHGQFFKWNADPARAPALSLHNTIFLAEQPARHGALDLTEIGTLHSCSNNVMVWGGEGPFPDAATLPDCFRISYDIDEWHGAVASWHARHPNRVRH